MVWLPALLAGMLAEGAVRSATFDVALSDGAHSIHALVASPKGSTPRGAVLFVHGSVFSAETWNSLGSLDALAAEGFRAIAIDVPGFGKFLSGDRRLSPRDVPELVSKLIEVAVPRQSERVVVVAASMGGVYGMPFVAAHADRVAGYVPIAALIDPSYTALKLPAVPTLIVYGENDRSGPVRALTYQSVFPAHQQYIFPNAPHPCYLKDPALFNRLLLEFVGAAPRASLHVTARW
jgi:abhydrolase domain-containing protein 14